MSARELITEHLELWTGAVKKKASSGRGSNGKAELTGVKKLRELILELAFKGKLLEQNPNSESAEILLARLQDERLELERSKKIKKRRKTNESTNIDNLNALPGNWRWSQLGEVAFKLTDGSHNPPKDAGSGIPMLSSQNVNFRRIDFDHPSRYLTVEDYVKEDTRTEARPGDVLLTIVASLGRAAVVPEEAPQFALQRSVAVIGTPLSSEFLAYQFIAPQCLNYYETHGKGTAQKGIYLGKLAAMPIAVPPLEEQHRIVEKIDELMALCDRLEQHASDQLEAHEILVDTLLGTLTQSENATELADNWARLAAHFDTLFTTEQSIDKLKQTILQLAVMGRLVEQDAGDDAATELLTSIESRKHELVKAKHIKLPKKLPGITSEEALFDIPRNWQWVKFGELGLFINGDRSKNYPNKEEYVERGVAWINTGHIEPNGTLTRTHMHFITREKYDSLRSGKIEPTDLVYCLRGATFGKTAFVAPYEEGAIASSLMIIRPYLPVMRSYIYHYLVSPFGRSQIFRFDNGSAQPNLSAKSVMMYAFPLPPLAEQGRIVEKVNELMALCDKLKERLNEASGTQCRLAEAVVEKSLG